MFACPIQTHFSPSRYASVKMSSEKVQNRFMLKNRKCITSIITLEGTEKIKTKKENLEATTVFVAVILQRW